MLLGGSRHVSHDWHATYDVMGWGISNAEPDLSKVASARVDLLAQ
jgi:hypothetical protein